VSKTFKEVISFCMLVSLITLVKVLLKLQVCVRVFVKVSGLIQMPSYQKSNNYGFVTLPYSQPIGMDVNYVLKRTRLLWA